MTKREMQLLNAFNSVLEAGLLGYNGELKSELRQLCVELERAAEDLPGAEVRSILLSAQGYYRAGDYRAGASELSRASRAWWREVTARY